LERKQPPRQAALRIVIIVGIVSWYLLRRQTEIADLLQQILLLHRTPQQFICTTNVSGRHQPYSLSMMKCFLLITFEHA